ncbi:MAG: ABC transporter substrate-binding protein [Lachnospiraceae bacterium]|jgi:hypothetical protein|nr:ABC transporter substrate-binding protein [Lachnospiraceae bacterium]
MNIDYYEARLAQSGEADFINRGLKDYQEGKAHDGKEAIHNLREKYGI